MKKIILTETHIITRNHKYFSELDMLCFNSKNLYNFALYHINKIIKPKEPINYDIIHNYNFLDINEYYKTLKTTYKNIYPNYNFMDKYLKMDGLDKDYRILPSVVAQQTLKKLDKNWLSYFKSISDYYINPSKYKAIPKPPRYLDKNGRFLAIYTGGSIIKNSNFKKGKIKLSGLEIVFPFINKRKNTLLLEVRIVPIDNNSLKIEVVYENKDQKKYQNINGLYAGIDLGLVNNATLTYLNTNPKIKLFIKPKIIRSSLTSINQYYNKKLALYTSELPKGVYTSQKIQKLTFDRNNKIKNEIHNISSVIVKELEKNKIETLCLGYSEGWKQKINIGKKNNQKFVQIPFYILISQLQYKCEKIGIKVIITEESYTSQSSFLDLDPLPIYKKGDNSKHKFSGKRVSRGLYITCNNKKINADVNGSYNQIRKATPTIIYNQRMLEGVLVSPSVYRIGKIEPVTHVRVTSNEKMYLKCKFKTLVSKKLDNIKL